MSSMIPKGSLVLVTGVNGFIAAQTAKQFLELGYKVRGTVRSQTKSKWLVDDAFRAETSSGAFELVTVEDIAKENAFQDAVRGVSSIIHVATIASLDPDPHNVVPQTIAAVVNLLKDAVKEPSVKSFVFTSSLGAAGMPLTDVPFEITKDSWNDMAVSLAWAPSPYETERGLVTYMASKVEAEKAFWKFVEDEKPSFTANTVLPFTTFGPLLSAQQTGSTSAWLCSLYRGDASAAGLLKAGYFIDVRDVAVIHVAAALDPSVNNARLNTWSEQFNWNDVLAIFRKLYPQKEFISDLEGNPRMLGRVDDALERQLLEKWGNRSAWIDLETGIRDTIEGPWTRN